MSINVSKKLIFSEPSFEAQWETISLSTHPNLPLLFLCRVYVNLFNHACHVLFINMSILYCAGVCWFIIYILLDSVTPACSGRVLRTFPVMQIPSKFIGAYVWNSVNYYYMIFTYKTLNAGSFSLDLQLQLAEQSHSLSSVGSRWNTHSACTEKHSANSNKLNTTYTHLKHTTITKRMETFQLSSALYC